MKEHWPLDPKIVFLNHGSFGSCPLAVLKFQQTMRDRLESQPVQFLVRDLEPLLDDSRLALSRFVGAYADNLVFVQNATTGVNTVLRSLTFQPGDELLVTNHEYNACRNALEFVATRSGAKVVVAALPFPLASASQLLDAVVSKITPRTRLALIDHITSQTALILPIAAIVRELTARGVDTIIDGAHAPGMVPLRLEELGAAYYTGNCHKWLCAPKTAALLHVRPDRQHLIHPLTISHGLTSPREDRSRFLIEFAWPGTWDPTACLCVPQALHFMGGLLAGGWPEIQLRNRNLALGARKMLCDALQINLPCPDECIGAMASIPLPDAKTSERAQPPNYIDAMQDILLFKNGIEVPVIAWPAFPKRLLRISAQLYNEICDYEKLAGALKYLTQEAR